MFSSSELDSQILQSTDQSLWLTAVEILFEKDEWKYANCIAGKYDIMPSATNTFGKIVTAGLTELTKIFRGLAPSYLSVLIISKPVSKYNLKSSKDSTLLSYPNIKPKATPG